MAQPTLLSIAKADLESAKRNVNDSNKHIKHHAAYFAQQSIEKTLKYLIMLKTGHLPWGHNLAQLVIIAESNGIYVPKLIKTNSNMYTLWEATSRYYPTKIIRRDAIQRAIDEVDNWHANLSKQGIK